MNENFLFEVGLTRPFAGWGAIGVFLLVILTYIIAASNATGAMWINVKDRKVTPREKDFYLNFFLKYPLWGTFQQLVMFTFLYWIKLRAPESPWNNWWMVAIFILIHFPNWYLMFPAAFLISFFAFHMDIYHNLLAVGVAHGMIATAYVFLSPDYVPVNLNTWMGFIKKQKALTARIEECDKKLG